MTRMGRPKKDNAKRATITIRMSDETHKKLNEYAIKHNMSMTEVALRSLEEYSIYIEGGNQYGKGTKRRAW